jgi:membrane protease YdiL (CAAX protease family)
MTSYPPQLAGQWPNPIYPAQWHPDPWGIAPLRWWDGYQWTPILHGTYGEAWPLPAPPILPKGPGIKGGGVAAVGAGVGFVGSIIVAIFFAAISSGNPFGNDPWYLLSSQIALWIGFLGAVIYACRVNGSKSLASDYGLSLPRWHDVWTGFSGGLAGRVPPTLILVLVALADRGFSSPTSTAPQVLGTTPTSTTGWVVVITLAVIGAPIVEELFFRGLIQGAFTRRVGAVPAIFVTALIFCSAHVLGEGPLAPVVLFPVGLILGYLRYQSGRLAPGMVAHATFNATLFVLFLVPAFR